MAIVALSVIIICAIIFLIYYIRKMDKKIRDGGVEILLCVSINCDEYENEFDTTME